MRLSAAVLLCVVTLWPSITAAEPPHIVVIMTDDQRADTMAYMPKTRALLGDVGTTFTNFIVTYPRCCPSRATFLTGQYSHNHGVRGNRAPNGGFTALDHTNTLATWLRAAGYHTAMIGVPLKEYDGTSIPPGWRSWQVFATKPFYYGFTLNDNGQRRTYGTAPENYQTDVLARLARGVIRNRPLSRPLFLYLAPHAPHARQNPPAIRDSHPELTFDYMPPAPRHVGLFDATPFPPPPAFNVGDVSGKLPQRHIIGASRIADIEVQWRASVTGLQAVDDLVESVVATLRTEGILDKTLIIFTSDNGQFHGEHRIAFGKYRPYNAALRVPLLVRGGGFPAGAVVDMLTANIDLAPTIVRLAGATAARVMDGRSLLPIALDPASGEGRHILLDGGARQAHPDDSGMYAGVRTNREHYVEYNGGIRELFLLNRDPHMTHNRYGDATTADVLRRMRMWLRRLEVCAGITCSRGTP
jgi:N-acetylglucosamine-6-sulfatase